MYLSTLHFPGPHKENSDSDGGDAVDAVFQDSDASDYEQPNSEAASEEVMTPVCCLTVSRL